MPQLDKFSFATQLFWFCALFLTYYLLLINKFLPNLLKILRLRTYRLVTFSTGVRDYLTEELLIRCSYINMLASDVKITQIFQMQIKNFYINWSQLYQITIL